MNNRPQDFSGFTLIELMVTLAIAAVVMGLAVPSFATAIKNNRLTTQVNMFVASLNVARSEAIKRGYRVALCKSSDEATCAAAGDWAQGWIIYADQNSNGVFDPAEAPPLKVQAGAPTQITMVGSSATVNSKISFSPSGATGSTGTIKVCDDRAENVGKSIVFIVTGRAHVNSLIPC